MSEDKENRIESSEDDEVKLGSEKILPSSCARSVNARDIIQSQIFTGDFYIGLQDAGAIGMAPAYPSLVVGRVDDLKELKVRLGVITGDEPAIGFQNITVVRGWPGVGKTTMVAKLAHDPDIQRLFPDGVLWTTLDRNPSVISKLAEWGRALRTSLVMNAQTETEASSQLTSLLRGKRILLIIDDVWDAETARFFMVGGQHCATILTTRSKTVAQHLAPTSDIYRLGVLNEEHSLDLLNRLAPTIVTNHAQHSRELVRALDGLPLAIRVAAHLLIAEQDTGLDLASLLLELRKGAVLLESKTPVDVTDIEHETTPTVATLLRKSSDRLDSVARECFAYLGVFAAEPASFDYPALAAIWQIRDPMPIAKVLVERGLIEPIGGGRFQIHSLLALHARSFLN